MFDGEFIRKDVPGSASGEADWYLVRKSTASGPRPCVIMLHGHGSQGDQLLKRADVREQMTAVLVRHNFHVISPNYRGNSWMSHAAVSELERILEAEKENLKWSKLFIVSGSMGGTSALIFAMLHPELIDGVGALGTATDPGTYMDWLAQNGTRPVHEDILNALRSAYPTHELALSHSATAHAERLRGIPVVVIHAADDATIPVSEARQLSAALKDAPLFHYEELPSGGHDAPLPYFSKALERLLSLTTQRDWRETYKLGQVTARPGDPFSSWPYNLGCYLEGCWFRENPAAAGESRSVRAARAFAYMLDHLEFRMYSEQEFFGCAEMVLQKELPAWLSAAEYEDAVLHRARDGQGRSFKAGKDHISIDGVRLLEEGLGGYISRAEDAFALYGNATSEAMLTVLKAVSSFFLRASRFCRASHPEVSMRLEKLSTQRPDTLAEGIQLLWLVYVILALNGCNHNALARLDQLLIGLYERDGLPEERVLDMLCHLWAQVECFHQVTNICIGGVKADGSDAVNDLSYLMLEATHRVHSASTNLSARLSPQTPERFLRACADLICTGIGFPAVFNDTVNVRMLTGLGFPLEAARDYALHGCVEPLVAGREVAWSDGRFSLPEVFLHALRQLPSCRDFEELFGIFEAEMREAATRYAEFYNVELKHYTAEEFPDPVLSAFIRDCIGRGRDINDGGAEFPRLHGVGMMGLGTLVDGMCAIRELVFEKKTVTPERLLHGLDTDYQDDEELRLMLKQCPLKYGNDIDACDALAVRIVDMCGRVCLEQPVFGGGYFLSCMASNIQNVSYGARLGATPDGRHAGEPLSDAASPSCGCDRNGPTAFVNSIVKPDYTSQACTVVNMRFLSETCQGEAGRQALVSLLKRFIDGEGQEMQFNVTHRGELADAVLHPEKYAGLIVRVSGFSAFFTRLAPAVQQNILARTAH